MVDVKILLVLCTVIPSFPTKEPINQCPVICECRYVLSVLRVSCDNIQLDHIPQELPILTNELHLENNALRVLPNNGFISLLNVKDLYLQANQLSVVNIYAFSGMVELRTLDLSGNFISSLPKDAFKDNLKLEVLRLTLNNFKAIVDFNPMPPFQELHFEKNQINTAKFPISYKNISLASVHLDGNPIQTLYSDDLVSLQERGGRLIEFSISNCSISRIDEAFMAKQKSLESINLSYNPINFSHSGQPRPKKDLGSTNSPSSDTVISSMYLNGLFDNGLPENMFAGLSKRHIKSLSLKDNCIPILKNYTFQDLASVKYVSLSNSQIEDLESHAFDGLHNLHILDLSHNNMTNIPERLPANVKIINFEGNIRLQILLDNSFKDIKNIEQIHLRACAIHTINPGSFSNLRRVSFLDLRNNRLTSDNTKYAIFQSLSDLDILLLGGNTFSSGLDQKLFTGLTKLRRLDLSFSSISNLSPTTFGFLSKLVHLDLSGNLLQQTASTADSLFQSNKDLEFLSMANNSIRYIKVTFFQHSQKLRSLDLSDNKMSNWDSELFKATVSLRYLRLDSNRISSITAPKLAHLSGLNAITLSGNPLICNCFLKWIQSWFKTTNTILSDRDETLCSAPSNVKGRKLMELTPSEFVCATPWYHTLFVVIISLCCVALVATVLYFRFQMEIRNFILQYRRKHEKAAPSEKETILMEPAESGFI